MGYWQDLGLMGLNQGYYSVYLWGGGLTLGGFRGVGKDDRYLEGGIVKGVKLVLGVL